MNPEPDDDLVLFIYLVCENDTICEQFPTSLSSSVLF